MKRERLLASTIIAGAAILAFPASAQTAGQPGNPMTDQAEAGASTGPIEGQTPASGNPDVQGSDGNNGAIIVTGSRIPQPNLTSAAPVTVLTQQEIKMQGTTRIEDLLNSLPQVFADQGSTISNGSTGTATVNLRNLGAARTLVLINGRRLMPGDPTDSAADLNFIPSSLVKRVEVLTGGASSTYGADAVAGVVNFIMDTDYEGVRLDGQYSLYQHTNRSDILRGANNARTAAGFANYGYPDGSVADGGTIDTTLTMGTSFADDRGHIVAYVGYRKVRPVTQDRRDYSSCTAQANAAGTLVCGGSLTSQQGTFLDHNSSSYQVTNGRTFTPGFSRYNFAPINYYQRPDQRYTGGFFAHYDINDAVKPYIEGMFMDDRTVAQIAPSGDFGNTFTINCDNPLLSGQQLGVACAPDNLVTGFIGTFPLTGTGAPVAFIDPSTGLPYNRGYLQILRRNVEGGPRQDDLQHTSYRGVIGSKGDLSDAISYDAYYQFGRTVFAETYLNDVSVSRLTKSLDVVNAGGTIECRSVETGEDPSCVPYDIFTPGGVTQGAINYLSTPGFQRADVDEQVASGTVTALLGKYGVKSPWADDGLGINVGAEYRKESLELRTDEEFSSGDLAGQGGATLPTSGSFRVAEAFGEASLPLVHESFIYDLTLTGGYRYSHYNLSNGNKFTTNTYKLDVEFAPIKDIRFRGGYNRAVRSPNIQELFSPQHVALDGGNDPCAGGIDDPAAAVPTVNGNTAAQCAFTGVTAAQFGNVTPNPAAQYNGLIGGEPNLRPERSTTKTVGVILQPRFAPRFSVTADYYDIKVTKAIQGFGEDTILATCAADGDPALCGLIHRNVVNGSLWLSPDGYVEDVEHNVGGVRTKGIDVSTSYSMEIGRFGSLGFNAVGTYLKDFVTNNGISPAYNCAGYFGLQCGTSAPKYRGKTRVSYTAPNGLGLSFQWRYFSRVKVDASSDNPTLAGAFSPFADHIKAQSYFDLVSTIKLGDHYNLRLGVNNFLDKRPPVINSNGALSNCTPVFCNGNTFPAVYDALGRYIYAGVTLDF